MASAYTSTSEGRARPARPTERERPVVGPNAAIQLIGALRLATDPESVRRILARAGVPEWGATPPEAMIDERLAAALHRATRETLDPERAKDVLTEAGSRTGDYILAHRIPAAARTVLRAVPAWAASRLLARAIAAHAWTFAGSGRFAASRDGGLAFAIANNPFCAGTTADEPICVWHAAVFERLFRALVAPTATFVETECCARGDPCCRFRLARSHPATIAAAASPPAPGPDNSPRRFRAG